MSESTDETILPILDTEDVRKVLAAVADLATTIYDEHKRSAVVGDVWIPKDAAGKPLGVAVQTVISFLIQPATLEELAGLEDRLREQVNAHETREIDVLANAPTSGARN